jgi:hypothetical protein
MRDEARRVLVKMVKDYGPAVADHPERFRGLFLDFAPWQVRTQSMDYIHALTRAAELGLVARLAAYRPPSPGQSAGTPAVFLRSITLEFEELLPTHKVEARWACEAWAVALGVIDEPPPEAILVIAHDPIPILQSAPVHVGAGAASPSVTRPPQPPPYIPPAKPARPAPAPIPPPLHPSATPASTPAQKPSRPPLPPQPRGAFDWLTPSLIQTVIGCALAAGLLTGLDSLILLLTRLFPVLLSWGPFAFPWALAVAWIWEQGLARAKDPGTPSSTNNRESIVWIGSGLVLLAAAHYWLWNVFTINYPGYQPVCMWAFHMAIGIPGIALIKYHTRANKFAEYLLVTMGAILVGMAFLDAGTAVAYHCPMWAMFLAIAWAWPFLSLFQRVQEPTRSFVTLWFVGWLVAFFLGQWLLLRLISQYVPSWDVWALIALHLFVGWTMVWMVHPNLQSPRKIIAALALLVICPFCVMLFGHALFFPT